MPKRTQKEGRPTATFEVQIVRESKTRIVMYLHQPGHKHSPIVFRASTGTSGPKAFEKLDKIIG